MCERQFCKIDILIFLNETKLYTTYKRGLCAAKLYDSMVFYGFFYSGYKRHTNRPTVYILEH